MHMDYSSLFQDLTFQERWDLVQNIKRNFLQNNVQDPNSLPQINPQLTESWIRSRNMGVDPYNPPVHRPLNRKEYEKILKENSLLIEITKPLVHNFKNMVVSTDYLLELIDTKGVSLLQEGELTLPPFAAQGTVFDERTMGTNAHTLSMILKYPIQLLGPEHYCIALQNIAASAAPIMDEAGEAIGSLVLTQPLKNPPWEESYQQMLSHTLGLITSMALAVEAQIKLKKSNEILMVINDRLATAYDTLEATLACVNEGIIAVDHTGSIIRFNREGARILKLRRDEAGQRNIKEFLDSQSRLMTLAHRGETASIEETFCVGGDEQPYFINIFPVFNQSNGQLDVAILRLNHSEKINSLVTSRSGATASFHFEDIVGESKALKKSIQLAQFFADSPENILLIGESGTGKELFAQAIHNQHRPNGPFMAVNCAAMPRELIESELFGYEGGSFTGAERSGRPGKIELAHGGTLFLDEIGDMPFELQAVLLRVLEDKQVMRIGGRRYKKVDFRVVAATNKNLYEMVKKNQFREDLYFRLSVLSINLPPLRQRDKDIELFSHYFIEKYCQKMNWKAPQISPEAQKIVNSYSWPGNVRQLENAMNYAINIARSGVIKPEHLPDNIILDNSPARAYGNSNSVTNLEEVLSLRQMEKAVIDLAMLRANNNIPRAAGLLEISKATLYRKLKEYENEQQ